MAEAGDDLAKRLVRLEEAQGFAERTSEQLGEEVRALSTRVSELQALVRRLEAQLSRLNASGESDAQGAEDA